jgi:hypothetical protein
MGHGSGRIATDRVLTTDCRSEVEPQPKRTTAFSYTIDIVTSEYVHRYAVYVYDLDFQCFRCRNRYRNRKPSITTTITIANAI